MQRTTQFFKRLIDRIVWFWKWGIVGKMYISCGCLVVLMVGGTIIGVILQRLFGPSEAELRPFIVGQQICQQRLGVPEAVTYTPGPGPHPVVFGDLQPSIGKWHGWNRKLPDSWRPASLSDLELVACVGDQEKVRIQTCTYIPFGTLIRYQYEVTVQVVEAQTGKTVDVHTVRGKPPPACPPTRRERIYEGKPPPGASPDVAGPYVSFNDVQEWLSQYVNSQAGEKEK